MVSGRHHRWALLPLALLAASPALAAGLQVLDDEGLSSVSGQDGVTIDFRTPTTGISITQANIKQDQAVPALATTLGASSISLKAVDLVGNVLSSPAHSQLRIDVGATSAASTTPYVSVEYDLDRSRLFVGGMNIAGDTADTCGGSACAQLPNRSFGTFALDASGLLRLKAPGGLFNGASFNTYFKGELNDATLFYRQTWFNHAYLIMNDMHALWELNKGKFGISPQGIIQATTDQSQNAGVGVGAGPVDPSSLLNVALDFDILFKYPALFAGTDQTTDFIITGNERPLMHFGWLGSMRNAQVVWKPGGAWTSASTTATGVPAGVANIYNTGARSQGINFSSRWDFVNYLDANTTLGDGTKEFRWQLGEAAGTNPADQSRMNFELGDWARWNSALYSHDFPQITLDVINAGAAQGVGGLCWGYYYDGPTCTGGKFINIDPGTVAGFDTQVNRATAKGLGLFVRDGNLMSYSRRVRLLERNAAGVTTTRDFKWGIIYTFANVDANVYIYAGGNEADAANGSRNGGLVMDVLLMSQTFNPGDPFTTAAARTQGFNWSNGSHLMISDTDINNNGIVGETRDAMGIGLVSSSFLLASTDMSLRLLNNMPSPDPGLAGRYNAADPYKAGIDLMSPKTRFNFVTTFGGGILPDSSGGYGAGPTVVKASLIQLNFEGMLNGRLSPAAPVSGAGSSFNPCSAAVTGYTCSNYLGYSWAMRFMDTNDANLSENTNGYAGWSGTALQLGDYGSYLSLAEPNRPDVDVRFSNITGDLALVNGVIDMVPTAQDGDGKPKLRISHTMVLGSASAARVTDAASNRSGWENGVVPGQEFRIDRVLLGGANLGRIVIPSATIYSSLTLKPQF